MKNLLIILILFLSVSTRLPAQNQNLKVISYNIWNGFDWGKDTERETSMVDWLRDQEADIIGLQELNAFTQEKLEQLAQQWGHPYAILLKEEGYPIGITSNTPLELKSKILGGLWHGMVHVKTRGIDFLVVHLSPHDWQFRRKEAEIITSYAQGVLLDNQQEKFMILGDFNAHSPFDTHFDGQNPLALKRNQESDSLRLEEKGPTAYQTLRNGALDYSVMSRFLSLPMIDVVQLHHLEVNKSSYPTPLITPEMSPEQRKKSRKRIDYILVSPYFESRCTGAKMINNGPPDQLSDHYPVMATFQINE
ncbi:MAG: endonuclease/exonuclease/phosphatase family protein [Cyclobacteriaceae bacterium]